MAHWHSSRPSANLTGGERKSTTTQLRDPVMVASPKTVLLFGLSADPPTGLEGHDGIVRWGAESLRFPAHETLPEAPVDQVWVFPVYRHAFSEKRQITPFAHRLEMARRAFEHLPGLEGRVKVLD